jgi:RNase P subunit RPR2
MSKKEKTFEKIKDLIYNKNPQNNKAAKKLAMKNNIKLGILRREFCQKCYQNLEKAKKRIKNRYLLITCNCGKKCKFKIS